VNQVTLLLLGLFGQNVAVESVLTLYLACSGESETLLCAGIGLYFWHFVNYLIIINIVAAHPKGTAHRFFS
jgi:hypothetical protein